jgi:hypothetical protein
METVALSSPAHRDVEERDSRFALNRGELLDQPARTRKRHKARAKVSNYCDLLPGVSGNDARARRFRDLVAAYIIDLGGLDQITDIKLGLVRRLAATTVQAEQIEASMVNGEQIDIATLCTLASTVMRLSARLGLEHRKPEQPDLHGPNGMLSRLTIDVEQPTKRGITTFGSEQTNE